MDKGINCFKYWMKGNNKCVNKNSYITSELDYITVLSSQTVNFKNILAIMEWNIDYAISPVFKRLSWKVWKQLKIPIKNTVVLMSNYSFLLLSHATSHLVTGKTPGELLFSRSFRPTLHLILPSKSIFSETLYKLNEWIWLYMCTHINYGREKSEHQGML